MFSLISKPDFLFVTPATSSLSILLLLLLGLFGFFVDVGLLPCFHHHQICKWVAFCRRRLWSWVGRQWALASLGCSTAIFWVVVSMPSYYLIMGIYALLSHPTPAASKSIFNGALEQGYTFVSRRMPFLQCWIDRLWLIHGYRFPRISYVILMNFYVFLCFRQRWYHRISGGSLFRQACLDISISSPSHDSGFAFIKAMFWLSWAVVWHTSHVVGSYFSTTMSTFLRDWVDLYRPTLLITASGETFELLTFSRRVLICCMLSDTNWQFAFTFPGPTRLEVVMSSSKSMVLCMKTFMYSVFNFKAIVRRNFITHSRLVEALCFITVFVIAF